MLDLSNAPLINVISFRSQRRGLHLALDYYKASTLSPLLLWITAN